MSASNGHEYQRLRDVLAYHEGIVAAIRTTLDALDKAAVRDSALPAAGGGIMISPTAAHVLGTLSLPTETPDDVGTKAPTLKRLATAKYLSGFGTTPTPAVDGRAHGIGVLVAHGYLRKKGVGYVRTSKAFIP
jgi:hypothetical protein